MRGEAADYEKEKVALGRRERLIGGESWRRGDGVVAEDAASATQRGDRGASRPGRRGGEYARWVWFNCWNGRWLPWERGGGGEVGGGIKRNKSSIVINSRGGAPTAVGLEAGGGGRNGGVVEDMMRRQSNKNHWLLRLRMLPASRGAGMLAAVMLALVTVLTVVNNFHIINFHFEQTSFVRELDEGRSVFFRSMQSSWGEHIIGPEDRRDSEQMRKFLLDTRDDIVEPLHEDNTATSRRQSLLNDSIPPPEVKHDTIVLNASRAPTLFLSMELPPDHPCQGFAFPPPPADKKRTGPRPCPVCYLPVKKAVEAMPASGMTPTPVLKQLNYVREPESAGTVVTTSPGSEFGGHPTLEDRSQSYLIQESMTVHCGFVKGEEPGVATGFDISEEDRLEMLKCHGVVVGSAIFGNYDELQQPKNISEEAQKKVCFFMFIDEETGKAFLNNANLRSTRKIGLWNMVIVRNLPYTDARRNGKIPKLLIHRLFPKARFSLWVDGKLQLVVDPYQILERFLWRTKDTWAISKHYARFDVFVEAEANKAAGKYDNATIDSQVEFYRSEGMTSYSSKKLPIVSDVPEGCVIIREHTPLSNLFGCLWFNEVDRFTSRDQLSFGIVRDKILAQVPWHVNMFLDCERRNFVVQGYHKDVLAQKALANSKKTGSDYQTLSKVRKGL